MSCRALDAGRGGGGGGGLLQDGGKMSKDKMFRETGTLVGLRSRQPFKSEETQSHCHLLVFFVLFYFNIIGSHPGEGRAGNKSQLRPQAMNMQELCQSQSLEGPV